MCTQDLTIVFFIVIADCASSPIRLKACMTVGEMFSTQAIAVNHPAFIGVSPDGGRVFYRCGHLP